MTTQPDVLFYITAKSKTDRSQGLTIKMVRKSEHPAPKDDVWPYDITGIREDHVLGGFYTQLAMKEIIRSIQPKRLDGYEAMGRAIAWWGLNLNEQKFEYLGHHEKFDREKFADSQEERVIVLFATLNDLKTLYESVETTKPFEEGIPDEGTCYLVREGTCGCCPREATVYGPYFSREKAEEKKAQVLMGKSGDSVFGVSVREREYELIHLADGRTWVALYDYLVRDTFVDLRTDPFTVTTLDSFAELYPSV